MASDFDDIYRVVLVRGSGCARFTFNFLRMFFPLLKKKGT